MTENYEEETRRWRAWAFRAAGDVLALWPDEVTWRERKAAGVPVVERPEGFAELCARPGGEQLALMYDVIEREA